jgi:hypothetical protein
VLLLVLMLVCMQVVDKATGETDAVDTKEALKGKYTALYFTSKQVEDQFLQGNEVTACT